MGAVGASDDKCIPNRLRWTVYKAATRLAMSTNIRKQNICKVIRKGKQKIM